jgi:hypothetical protein
MLPQAGTGEIAAILFPKPPLELLPHNMHDLGAERASLIPGKPGPHMLHNRRGNPMANVRCAALAPGIAIAHGHCAV